MQWIGHRGAARSNPSLENTLTAFQRCVGEIDGIELDVHLTKDKEIVVVHDSEIGGIPISSLSWPDIHHSYPFIPRLKEVIEWLRTNSLLLYLEIKPGYSGIIPIILRFIQPIVERVTIISFSRIYLEEISKWRPEIKLGYLVEDYSTLISYLSNLNPFWMVGISYSLLDKIDKSFYPSLNVWTVNSLDQIDRCQKLGVKSITSDFLPSDL